MPAREIPKNRRETVRVSPRQYEGHDLIDIRVFTRHPETKELVPTKKGISLNIDTIPELVDALMWALGQPCEVEDGTPERKLDQVDADKLAEVTWHALKQHGSAVHWDSVEKMVVKSIKGFSKWDLHYVLAARKDLFERTGQGCFRARKRG